MANVVINTDLQSMLIDFGVYGSGTYPANGKPLPLKSAFDKDYVKTFDKTLLPGGTDVVQVTMSDSIKFFATWNQSNTDPNVLIIDSVEGTAPTSNDHLLSLLSQSKYVTYKPYNISSAGTYTIKTGGGVLHAVNVTSAVISTSVKVYDGGISGALLAEIPFGLSLVQSQVNLIFDVAFYTSLVVVTTGVVKVSVSYK